jgi:hypothetical protein
MYFFYFVLGTGQSCLPGLLCIELVLSIVKRRGMDYVWMGLPAHSLQLFMQLVTWNVPR